MLRKKINRIILLLGIITLFGVNNLQAEIDRSKYGKEHSELQAREVISVFDLQTNTVSDIEFYTTNYGIFGFDIRNSVGGGIWPRGSRNQYIFGGGIWFGARKKQYDTSSYRRKYVLVTYDPNSGSSWMVPGRINEEGPDGNASLDEMTYDASDMTQYRTYFSTDFVPADGTVIGGGEYENWPIWDNSEDPEDTLQYRGYFGNYVEDPDFRNVDTYKKGPAFISGEDIFSTYKDTDLDRYNGGISRRKEEGYPLMIQFEQMIYSWGFGDYKDFVFLKYELTNYSEDTLWDCWLAPVMDIDIALQPNTRFGADNDRADFYDCPDVNGDPDTTLNLAYQWTNTDRGEAGQGFGYLGFDFLESPAVTQYYDTTYVTDNDGNVIDTVLTERLPLPGEEGAYFVRKDKKVYSNREQLGLKTFRNWSIQDDKKEDAVRYDFISAGFKDGDTGPGDKRFMMATGPFHMRPHDTVRVVVGLVIADAAVKDEPDGSCPDLAELVRKDIFMQQVYDNNFQAPRPPDRAVITMTQGYNHGTKIMWDESSELSNDKYEDGLDFMGYQIYRARRPELTEYNKYETENSGPFGWKLLEQYQMPTPFFASQHKSGPEDDMDYPFIDSLRIIGPYVDANGNVLDTMAFYVMRVPRGVIINDGGDPLSSQIAPELAQNGLNMLLGEVPYIIPYAQDDNGDFIVADTGFYRAPWGKYWDKLWNDSQIKRIYFHPDTNRQNPLMKSLVGVARLNKATMKYNPMYFRQRTVEITQSELDDILSAFPDGVVRDSLIVYNADSTEIERIEYYHPFEVYFPKTYRTANIDGQQLNVIDKLERKPINSFMLDSGYVTSLHKQMYDFIKDGRIKEVEFKEVESDEYVRKEVIVPYMEKITNNRTFIDIGDDDGDAVIDYDEDPEETEKLINNIPYYYKVLAFDQGDYKQPTNMKINDGSEGLPNFAEIYPKAAPVSEKVSFEIIDVDSNRIGGLRNFNFFAIDLQRALQKYGGDTLEMTFEPWWRNYDIQFLGSEVAVPVTLYSSWVTIKNLSKNNQTLFRNSISYEVQACSGSFRQAFTEDAQTYVFAPVDSLLIDPISGDTLTFNQPRSKEIADRSGTWTTGDFTSPGFCHTYGFTDDAFGTIGFSFDFYMQQYGGVFRPDVDAIKNAKSPDEDAVTPVNVSTNINAADRGRTITYDPFFNNVWVNPTTGDIASFYGITMDGSFNNGPGIYEVEFLPGGTETLDVKFGSDYENNATFNVEYLTMRVRNVLTNEVVLNSGETDVVSYPTEMPHITLPDTEELPIGNISEKYYPEPENLATQPGNSFPGVPYRDYNLTTNEFIGKFNLAAYGWVDSRGVKDFFIGTLKSAPANGPDETQNLGQQGRYYLSAKSTDGQHQLDFTHVLNISGVKFGIDYANRGRFSTTNIEWTPVDADEYQFGNDFEPGDKLTLQTFGGAFGLPLPGAKVKIKVSEPTETKEISDGLMDDIKVVPNPYYISHQGVKSPYDNKLYFTRLPERATIDIYTINGDHVITLDYDEFSDGEGRKGVKVWDLLSKNKQRVQSQAFIAVIKTPDGAETVEKFSIVVGGFNINTQGN